MDAKILVVDDAKFMRRVLRHTLGEAGYKDIAEAENGEEALLRYRRERPDLVLLDITMPGMPGMEALSRLLALDPTAKVLLCSAVGQDSVVQTAIQAGACGFVKKPFSPQELLAAVAAALPGTPEYKEEEREL